MTGDDKEEDNRERLLTHLKDGSLAAQFVQAHKRGGISEMKTVLAERLAEMTKGLGGAED